MAVVTKAVNKPFYVVAESFKFVRLYPLNQEDVPNSFKVSFVNQVSLTASGCDRFRSVSLCVNVFSCWKRQC